MIFLFNFGFIFSHEFSIAMMFNNNAFYLKEWIAYHHLIGCDHFYLYDHDSTDDWQKELQTYVDAGIVEVTHWPKITEGWLFEQIEAYKDAIIKAKDNKDEWIAIIDSDEFLLPMQDNTLKDVVKRYPEETGAIYVNWRNFGTSHYSLYPYEPMLPHLTRCSSENHSENAVGKSIIKLENIDVHSIDNVHVFSLLKGYYFDGRLCKMNEYSENNRMIVPQRSQTEIIRINHYKLRDENYFWNVRLPRDQYSEVTKELYYLLDQDEDFEILKFLEKSHPEKYQEIWKQN